MPVPAGLITSLVNRRQDRKVFRSTGAESRPAWSGYRRHGAVSACRILTLSPGNPDCPGIILRCLPGCLPGPLIVYTVTGTTSSNQIMGQVAPDTLYTGLIDPFECTVDYRHDNLRSPRRRLDRFMARTLEVAAA